MMSLFNTFDSSLPMFNMFIFSIFICFLTLKIYFVSSFSFIKFFLLPKLSFSFLLTLKPLFFSKEVLLFVYILFFALFYLNLSSVFSFNFPVTSQISVILFISLSFWGSLFIFSLTNNLKGFAAHLVPEGSPLYLTVFLYLIEIVSIMIRPLTLTIRLVANILAGHLLMILLSKMVFSVSMLFTFFYLLLNLIEVFVALIQSYIFSTMLTLYFSEMS